MNGKIVMVISLLLAMSCLMSCFSTVLGEPTINVTTLPSQLDIYWRYGKSGLMLGILSIVQYSGTGNVTVVICRWISLYGWDMAQVTFCGRSGTLDLGSVYIEKLGTNIYILVSGFYDVTTELEFSTYNAVVGANIYVWIS